MIKLKEFETGFLETYNTRVKQEIVEALDKFIKELPKLEEETLKNGGKAIEVDIFSSQVLTPYKFAEMIIEDNDLLCPFEEFETNSWEMDFWGDFTYKCQSFTLSGSGYYGGVKIAFYKDLI